MSAYETRINALFSRTGSTARLGLERTRALLAQLGNPHERLECLHIAGTNGKGSVVAMLYALLRAKGLSVGRYTSPHLVDFRERIVVDDEEIGEHEVLRFLDRWEGEGDRIGATFFELTTVLAFEHFAGRNVDVAVIETGMGGRLDATSVITPLVAGVTSVSMDHSDYLGDSLREIAREKAGIFKPGRPAVLGPLPPEANAAAAECAERVGVSRLIHALEEYDIRHTRTTACGSEIELAHRGETHTVHLGLPGAHQGANTAVALAMLDAAGPAFAAPVAEAARVLPDVRLPGRFQCIGSFLLDVAHNVEGVRALVATLHDAELPRPVVAVVGVMRDKPWGEMLALLATAADQLIVTTPATAPEGRSWRLDEVVAAAMTRGIQVEPVSLLSDALAAAERARATVLVTGSFYTVGEALALLRARPGVSNVPRRSVTG